MVCAHQPIPSALTVTFRPKIHYRAGFAELLVLEHLGLRVHQRVRIAENEWPEEEVFPAFRRREINEILLPLAHLYSVHILIWGDRSLPSMGCTSCDKHQWLLPDFSVEYRFGRPMSVSVG
jgi:hypothetical protein